MKKITLLIAILSIISCSKNNDPTPLRLEAYSSNTLFNGERSYYLEEYGDTVFLKQQYPGRKNRVGDMYNYILFPHNPVATKEFADSDYTTTTNTDTESDKDMLVQFAINSFFLASGQTVSIRVYNGSNDTVFVTCKYAGLRIDKPKYLGGTKYYRGNFVGYYIKK